MEKKYLTLKELQNASLDLMIEFDSVCKKYGLRYDIVGGTLLGAVRHHGFIPWDDDMDVNMPRPDYEKFLKLYYSGKIKLAANRKIISNRDHSFARHFTRYIRLDLLKESQYADDSDNLYVGLDIFTEDGIPSNERKFRNQIKTIELKRKLLLISLSRPGTSSHGQGRAFLKDMMRPFLKRYGSFRLADELENVCRQTPFDTAKYVGALNGMYGRKEKWLKSEWLPQREFEFEGFRFTGYYNYDIYLRNLYGDYMILPSADKRNPPEYKAYWMSK